MTGEPHCLCEQCKMTVLQCKERPAKESSDKVLEELEHSLECLAFHPDTLKSPLVVLLSVIKLQIAELQQQQEEREKK